MRRSLLVLTVVGIALVVHTIVTDHETKEADARGAKVLDLPGGDLRYKDEGDRDDPPVVLLHGFACSLEWWDRLVPELTRSGFRVVRFDLLGHGGSEKPRHGYAMDEQARRIARALEKLGVRKATVVGHSMGGTVASALAEESPELVERVAVLGTSPRNGFADLPISGKVAKWPVVGELSRRFAPDQLIKAGLEAAFAERVEVPERFVDDLDGMTYSSFDKSGDESHDYLEQKRNSERIAKAGIPLLVIFGAEDDIVDPDAAQAWREDVRGAKVVTFRGVGHSPHWERPGQSAKQIKAFAR